MTPNNTMIAPSERLRLAPFERIAPTDRPDALRGTVLLCDHASNTIPPGIEPPGLPDEDMQRHIAWDPGARGVTLGLARRLGAGAVLSTWSRLIIDPNRGEDDPTLLMRLYDGSVIPGNRRAGQAEKERRLEMLHRPYHRAIDAAIDGEIAHGHAPALVSIHSFTPQLRGRPPRPWHVGLLWDRDDRLLRPLLRLLRAEPDLCIGDNEPYTGSLEGDCMHRHGTARGIPHILIEIRNDLIATPADQEAWAERLAPMLRAAITEAATSHDDPAPRSEESAMTDRTTELEAAVYRRLRDHLRTRSDVQNIDLMNLAGFCRNCLGRWYQEAAAEAGDELTRAEARELVYGEPYETWRDRHQTEATPAQLAALKETQQH